MFTAREDAHAKDHFSKLKQSGALKFEHVRKFAAIAYNEVLLNSKRVAPYAVAILCGGNALLWWGWGPATGRDLATNSDAFVAGVLPAYSFLFLPLYTALIMADPAIRDFRNRIDPLIFSKPISRAEYLLGKFFGNFLVLACCQSVFVLTLFVLQWIPKRGMIVQEAKLLAYPKHFLVFVAMSHVVLAAFYFTVGTLTRNAKIVYGLGVAFYPLYISYQAVLLKSLPSRWRIVLDPLLMNWRGAGQVHTTGAEVLNRLAITYDADLIVNRVVMILLTAICLTILYVRFSMTERPGKVENFSVLNLSTAAEGVYYPESSPTPLDEFTSRDYEAISTGVAIPEVVRVNEGIRTNVNKLIAALGVEFRLLRAERSLVVVMPLAFFLSIMEVAFYNLPADVSHSAAYATNTANLLLLFLIGIAVFYTGEAMHRDREIRIEPVLWATPAPNNALLLSKFLATFLLVLILIAVVGPAGVVIQIFRGHTPVDLSAYLRVYGIVLLPTTVFVAAFSLALNVILRNKHVAYVVSIGTAAGLFYLYNIGHNHWLYNTAMFRLWSYADLTTPTSLRMILWRRAFWLAIAILWIALAHLLFQRKASTGIIRGRRSSGQLAVPDHSD
jgi:ABC-type transport system involved in multi-copper enzyme maturation permease subunit